MLHHSFNRVFTCACVAMLGSCFAACGDTDSWNDPEASSSQFEGCSIDDDGPGCGNFSTGLASPVAAESVGTVVAAEGDGFVELPYEVHDGLALYEGDIVLGEADTFERAEKGAGIELRANRWPDRRIPYVLSPDLNPVMAARVQSAIQYWAANTDIDFVQRNGEANYVRFVNSNQCSSMVGRQGGEQLIRLTTGKSASHVRGMAIAKSTNWVFTWDDEGFVYAGSSTNLDSRRSQAPYTMPEGYTPARIVGMAISGTDRVYTYYDNYRYSIGTSYDLGAHQAPMPYSLPSGYTPADIVGLDIAYDTGYLYAWYDDGKLSAGTGSDLDARIPLKGNYTLPSGISRSQIVEMGITNSNGVYVWYDNNPSQPQMSAGTTMDLDATIAPRNYSLPGNCDDGAVRHEMGHAVGLWHEQSRCDRDTYVTINWDNIQDGKAHNFEKKCGTDGRDLSTYDFTSLMHYPSWAFNKNGLDTIVAKPGYGPIAPGSVLSSRDLISVKELYGYSPAKDRYPSQILGMSIAKSNDSVFAWWSTGKVSAGSSWDLDEDRAQTGFSVAAGKSLSQLIGVGIASNDHCYAWYSDGTVSAGTSTDLDYYKAASSFSPASGKTVSQIIAIDIAPDDHVYAFYSDGTVSAGTSTDLDRYRSPYAFATAAGESRANIMEIGIAKNSNVYTWYRDYKMSIGSTSDLDSVQATW